MKTPDLHRGRAFLRLGRQAAASLFAPLAQGGCLRRIRYQANELPQPQVVLAFGFSNLKPPPIRSLE